MGTVYAASWLTSTKRARRRTIRRTPSSPQCDGTLARAAADGDDGPREKRLRPGQLCLWIECRHQEFPDAIPGTVGLPLSEATPTGDPTPIFCREVIPTATGAQHVEDTLERAAV